jgi:hypothetical protein
MTGRRSPLTPDPASASCDRLDASRSVRDALIRSSLWRSSQIHTVTWLVTATIRPIGASELVSRLSRSSYRHPGFAGGG